MCVSILFSQLIATSFIFCDKSMAQTWILSQQHQIFTISNVYLYPPQPVRQKLGLWSSPVHVHMCFQRFHNPQQPYTRRLGLWSSRPHSWPAKHGQTFSMYELTSAGIGTLECWVCNLSDVGGHRALNARRGRDDHVPSASPHVPPTFSESSAARYTMAGVVVVTNAHLTGEARSNI